MEVLFSKAENQENKIHKLISSKLEMWAHEKGAMSFP
jgi:hypothetical protein